ncbi:MAG: hypothetical protein ACYS80_25475, partial [Planctomycetota bacterium]
MYAKLSISSVVLLILAVACVAFAGVYDSLYDQLYDGGDYQPIQKAVPRTMERHLESSRAENPRRRASEDKYPNAADNLWDMELPVWPHFDISPWNWDINFDWYPDPYDGPRTPWKPEDAFDPFDPSGWYLFGCWISCFPAVIDCTREYFECTITTSQIISSIEVTGHVNDWYLDGDTLIVKPSPQALDGSRINIKVCTAPLSGQEKAGCCSVSLPVECGEECECLGFPVVIVADATTESNLGDICDGGNTSGTFSVNSDGLACPPYEWELTPAGDGGGKTGGNGFLLNGQLFGTAETNADGETVTVSSSGACGGALLTVTDDCGVSDSYSIRCSDSGAWVVIAQGCGACQLPGAANQSSAGICGNCYVRQIGDKRQEHWVRGFS